MTLYKKSNTYQKLTFCGKPGIPDTIIVSSVPTLAQPSLFRTNRINYEYELLLSQSKCTIRHALSQKNNCILISSNHHHNLFGSRTFDVNVKAVLNISQVVARKMVENNTHGVIVNISSQASKVLSFLKLKLINSPIGMKICI